MYNKKVLFILLILILIVISIGCSDKISMEKEENLEFTVVQHGDCPEELQRLIAQKREEKFHLSYKDNGEMYICVGYGKQPTGGYSVNVKEVYTTENAICVDTTLIGPNENDLVLKASSFPYVVIKVEYLERKIIYDD